MLCMLRGPVGFLLLSGVLVLSGCGGVNEDEPRLTLLRGRLDAALGIEGDSAKKDSALSGIAKDAARAGDAGLATQALEKIVEPERGDRAASAVALSLAKAGKSGYANRLAKRIKDATLKDETLVKIAGATQSAVLRGRLDAALSIKDDSAKKDSALSQVAKDAADAGETELVDEALRAMATSEQRDSAAEEAAVALARVGKTDDALFHARKLEDQAKRDTAFERIAMATQVAAPPDRVREDAVDSAPQGISNPPQNLTIDGISAIAVIVIASFAIDRVVRLVLFGLTLWSFSRRWLPDPESIVADEQGDDAKIVGTDGQPIRGRVRWTRAKAEKMHKAAYYALCFAFGAGVLGALGQVTIFRALGFRATWFPLDCIMTGLILTAGAERVAGLLKLPGAPETAEPAPPRPIEVKGTLKLEGRESGKLADQAAQQDD